MQSKLKVNLIEHTPNPDKVVALAGKLCYSPSSIDDLEESLTEDNVNKFVNMLSELSHESPMEHVSFTFGVEGISRSLTHQLVRHRIASYSQQSQRYVKSNEFDYVIPEEIENNEFTKEIFIQAMKDSQKSYDTIVDSLIYRDILDYWDCEGIPYEILLEETKLEMINTFRLNHPKAYSKMEKSAIENARSVLPNACETKIIFTMNARTLLNFFSERCCDRAQSEIRQMAFEMLKQVKVIAPILFKNAGASCVRLGYCKESNMSCGRYITKKVLLEKAKEQGLKVKI